MEFADRFRFIREHIYGFHGAEGMKSFAQEIDSHWKTVQTWESKTKNKLPNGQMLQRILEAFGANKVNLNWLLTGDGEPYPGARENHPEICGKQTPCIKEVFKEKPAQIKEKEEYPFKISDDVMKAIRVLESGTSYAAALHLNIVHFDRAVTAEEKIARLEAENMEIRRKNANLESRVAELEAKMERLLEEVVPEKKRQAL